MPPKLSGGYEPTVTKEEKTDMAKKKVSKLSGKSFPFLSCRWWIVCPIRSNCAKKVSPCFAGEIPLPLIFLTGILIPEMELCQ